MRDGHGDGSHCRGCCTRSHSRRWGWNTLDTVLVANKSRAARGRPNWISCTALLRPLIITGTILILCRRCFFFIHHYLLLRSKFLGGLHTLDTITNVADQTITAVSWEVTTGGAALLRTVTISCTGAFFDARTDSTPLIYCTGVDAKKTFTSKTITTGLRPIGVCGSTIDSTVVDLATNVFSANNGAFIWLFLRLCSLLVGSIVRIDAAKSVADEAERYQQKEE